MVIAQNLKAIGFAILGYGLYAVNDAVVKLLALSYTVPQTLFWTAFFILPVVVGYGLVVGGRKVFTSTVWPWHLWHGLAMTALVFCTLFALIQLRMTDFYAIIFTTPMAIALAGWLVLKDKLSKPQIFTVIAGFLMILYMCRPGSELFNLGALAALGGTGFLAIASLIVRSHLRAENALMVALDAPVVIALVSLPISLYYGFTFPVDVRSLALFIFSGISAGCAGVFFIKGFQYATTAAAVAPFHYTQMIWGAVLGYMIFGEIPSPNVILGACGLAILGLYLIVSEARAKHVLSEDIKAKVMQEHL